MRCDVERRAHDGAAWTLLTLIALLIGVLELRQPLAIDPASCIPFLAACAPVVAVALFYSRYRPHENFPVIAVCLLQMLGFMALGLVFQYLLAREGGEMWDPQLAAWDKALGLDWTAFVRAVDANPLLARSLWIAYAAMIPEAFAVVLILGFFNCVDRARTFVLAAMICALVTILLSPMFPSVSAYVFLGLEAEQFQHLNNIVPGHREFLELAAVRSGAVDLVRLPELQGIITFPSYHAGLATISAWALLGTRRIKWVRWPGALLAIGTIVSAPVHGGHYFVDVLAGIAIAACSILSAKRLVFWPGTSRPRIAGDPEPVPIPTT